jgi:hypothetical protein
VRTVREALGREQPGNLIRLAAKSNHHNTPEVGVARIAAQRPLQDIQALAIGIYGAPRTVRQRDDTIDVREFGERLRIDVAPESIGDGTGDGRRAIH